MRRFDRLWDQHRLPTIFSNVGKSSQRKSNLNYKNRFTQGKDDLPKCRVPLAFVLLFLLKFQLDLGLVLNL